MHHRSEQEGDASEHTTTEHLGEEWRKSSLWRATTVKPKKSPGCSLAEGCRAMAHDWLNRAQIISEEVTDFSDWSAPK